MMEILKAGLLTTVQDLGRSGSRHLGVGRAGALDSVSMRVANRLVGNPDAAAGIEITVGQPVEIRFTSDTRISLAGAGCDAFLEDVPVHVWWSVPVTAGQILSIGTASSGMRIYLAVAGGIDVPELLGSRSTDLKGGFGGKEGQPLRDGDVLQQGEVGAEHLAGRALPQTAPAFGVKPPTWCDFAQIRPNIPSTLRTGLLASAPTCVRVLRGPEYASFTSAAHESLWQAPWAVTPQSNRMGYRLKGPALLRKAGTDLLSHAVLPGTIQVPPDGQPILLMGDAQTAGGYPKIGMVITADLWLLAQARLNTALRFVECGHADARAALQGVESYFRQLDLAIRMNAERYHKRAG